MRMRMDWLRHGHEMAGAVARPTSCGEKAMSGLINCPFCANATRRYAEVVTEMKDGKSGLLIYECARCFGWYDEHGGVAHWPIAKPKRGRLKAVRKSR